MTLRENIQRYLDNQEPAVPHRKITAFKNPIVGDFHAIDDNLFANIVSTFSTGIKEVTTYPFGSKYDPGLMVRDFGPKIEFYGVFYEFEKERLGENIVPFNVVENIRVKTTEGVRTVSKAVVQERDPLRNFFAYRLIKAVHEKNLEEYKRLLSLIDDFRKKIGKMGFYQIMNIPGSFVIREDRILMRDCHLLPPVNEDFVARWQGENPIRRWLMRLAGSSGFKHFSQFRFLQDGESKKAFQQALKDFRRRSNEYTGANGPQEVLEKYLENPGKKRRVPDVKIPKNQFSSH